MNITIEGGKDGVSDGKVLGPFADGKEIVVLYVHDGPKACHQVVVELNIARQIAKAVNDHDHALAYERGDLCSICGWDYKNGAHPRQHVSVVS